jgi:hypothetical protein
MVSRASQKLAVRTSGGTVCPGGMEGDQDSACFARLAKHLPTIKQPSDSRKIVTRHPEPLEGINRPRTDL